jgi:hypothetical protein
MIDGSSPVLKTITNQKGEYSITGLKTGLYDIVFTMQGYCLYKIISRQFIGGNTALFIEPQTLYKLPDFTLSDLKVDTGRTSYGGIYGSYFVKLSGKILNSGTSYCQYYISERQDVSYKNYQATDYNIISGTSGSFYFSLSSSIINKFKKGDKLYFIVYPSANTYQSYRDIETGNLIYSINIDKASSIIPFTIPVVPPTYNFVTY